MNKELKIKRSFPLSRTEIFRYFTDPELIEQWAYPDGLSLRIPQFNLRTNGKYRYEHEGRNGKFVCVGKFTEIEPNQKLVMIDERITGPDGNVVFENLGCTQVFRDTRAGSEVEVIQEGFKDEQALNDCRQGWEQSLNHLSALIDRDLGSQIAI